MARERTAERHHEHPNRMVTAVGLLILATAGFAVGMVAGVAWEDPGLVVAYLAGETEEVAWSESGAEGTPPRLAEAPAGGARPVDPQIRREQERASREAAARVPPVAAAPVGSIAVQVGAFGTSQAAESLADSLRGKGFPVYVSPGTKAGEERWRVRVGPLPSREKAEATAERLKQVEKLPTWILSEDAS